jgi:hypothetical protein
VGGWRLGNLWNYESISIIHLVIKFGVEYVLSGLFCMARGGS